MSGRRHYPSLGKSGAGVDSQEMTEQSHRRRRLSNDARVFRAELRPRGNDARVKVAAGLAAVGRHSRARADGSPDLRPIRSLRWPATSSVVFCGDYAPLRVVGQGRP
jgi:hypothetical protein